RRAIGARLRDRLLGNARNFVARQLAARRESPSTGDERSNAKTVRLVVGDTRDALLARRDVLRAIANEADVRVVGAGTFCGVERAGRQLAGVGPAGRMWGVRWS